MKILQIITKSELGGAQSVLVQLANRLCQDHDVMVVAGEGDGLLWTLLDKRIRQKPCKYLVRNLDMKKDMQALYFFYQLRKEFNPDIIHLHSSKVGALGRIAFPRNKIVYTVHGFDSLRIAFRKFLPIEKLLQNQCKAIVGVSHYDTHNMRIEQITHALHTIYNGINVELQLPPTPSILPQGYDKMVLCIARIAPPKNFELFLEVARLLPQYAFVWIGNLEKVTNVPHNVYMLGNITNASRYCQFADVFILPSNYEGLPMAIIEAMSYGKPVVASNVGGVHEIVRNGINGFVVENKPEIFANKISGILDNEETYKAFSTQSRHIYETELTAETMVAKYIEIYKS